MGLATLLTELFEHWRLHVPAVGKLEPAELLAAEEVLRSREADVRAEFPGAAPEFFPEAAVWGAAMLLRACQFLVYRDLDAEALVAALAPPCPRASTPAAHYSVDLTFRFLPDLVRLARAASPDDPLVGALLHLARQWPLSSIGIAVGEAANASETSIDVLAAHPALWRAYVDRVIALGDMPRMSNPRVQAGVREALGMFTELAPKLLPADQLEQRSKIALETAP